MRRESGFTLIELMLTIAVAAILLGVGIPSFSNMIETNRRTAVVNGLVTDIHAARAEAMARNVDVVLCRGNGNDASPGCTTGAEWSSGWLAFVDADDDGTFDSGTEDIIAVQSRIPNGINLYGSSASVVFSRFGGTSDSFSVCIDNDDNRLQGVLLDRGRPRLGRKQANGSDLTCG